MSNGAPPAGTVISRNQYTIPHCAVGGIGGSGTPKSIDHSFGIQPENFSGASSPDLTLERLEE
jgi:hypothetical protein